MMPLMEQRKKKLFANIFYPLLVRENCVAQRTIVDLPRWQNKIFYGSLSQEPVANEAVPDSSRRREQTHGRRMRRNYLDRPLLCSKLMVLTFV